MARQGMEFEENEITKPSYSVQALKILFRADLGLHIFLRFPLIWYLL